MRGFRAILLCCAVTLARLAPAGNGATRATRPWWSFFLQPGCRYPQYVADWDDLFKAAPRFASARSMD